MPPSIHDKYCLLNGIFLEKNTDLSFNVILSFLLDIELSSTEVKINIKRAASCIMNSLLIVAIGIVSVLVCIILLRLHVAIFLLFAAFITGILCPQFQLQQFAIQSGMTELNATNFSYQTIGARLSIAFGTKTIEEMG